MGGCHRPPRRCRPPPHRPVSWLAAGAPQAQPCAAPLSSPCWPRPSAWPWPRSAPARARRTAPLLAPSCRPTKTPTPSSRRHVLQGCFGAACHVSAPAAGCRRGGVAGQEGRGSLARAHTARPLWHTVFAVNLRSAPTPSACPLPAPLPRSAGPGGRLRGGQEHPAGQLPGRQGGRDVPLAQCRAASHAPPPPPPPPASACSSLLPLFPQTPPLEQYWNQQLRPFDTPGSVAIVVIDLQPLFNDEKSPWGGPDNLATYKCGGKMTACPCPPLAALRAPANALRPEPQPLLMHPPPPPLPFSLSAASCPRWRRWRARWASIAAPTASPPARCALHSQSRSHQHSLHNATPSHHPSCSPPHSPTLAQAIFTQFITSEEKGTGKGTWARYYADAPGDGAGAGAAGAGLPSRCGCAHRHPARSSPLPWRPPSHVPAPLFHPTPSLLLLNSLSPHLFPPPPAPTQSPSRSWRRRAWTPPTCWA